MDNGPLFTPETSLEEAIRHPAFSGFGRLLFPLQREYLRGEALVTLAFQWYTPLRPEETLAVLHDLARRSAAGEAVFYPLYTDAEQAAAPAKGDTGLFFFRGRRGGRCAICVAGGGFRYVGALHDSFPQALALAHRGYNALALIYRPGPRTGQEDLARAIAFLHRHREKLQVETRGYSLWGGSAGAWLAAQVAALGTESCGEAPCPRPAAVILQYTGFSKTYGSDPPTYACVGAEDGIARSRSMKRRVEALRAQGIPAEYEEFPALGHGFGLGTGTPAEGWLDRAIAFWERQLP